MRARLGVVRVELVSKRARAREKYFIVGADGG